jgi:hypothetical protein
MATKRQRRKRRRRREDVEGAGTGSPPPAPVAVGEAQRAPVARRRSAPGGPPPAPWGSFPLSELVVLIALLMLVGGFFVTPPRGAVMIGAGLVLGSLAGLELAMREHLAGYRSHTLLLAGAVGMVVFGGLFVGFRSLSPAICAGAGALAFAVAAWPLTSLFRSRSGGALFRVRGQ